MRHALCHPYTLATVWAGALIASSYLGRGSAIGNWIDAALYLAAGLWIAHAIAPEKAA